MRPPTPNNRGLIAVASKLAADSISNWGLKASSSSSSSSSPASTSSSSSQFNGRWQDVVSYFRDIRRLLLLEPHHRHQLSDPSLISSLLRACSSTTSTFRHGLSLHACLLKLGLTSFTDVRNSTLDFYVKSGSLHSAFNFFLATPAWDSVSWNIIIRGCLKQGGADDEGDGLWWFSLARAAAFEPNDSTLVLLVQACRRHSAGHHRQGPKIHAYLIRSGFASIRSVQNTLLRLYVDCCPLDAAQKLFDEMSDRDVVSWSILIGTYARDDKPRHSLLLFRDMACEAEMDPDGVTSVNVLRACSDLGDIAVGRMVHGFVVGRGHLFDVFVGNSLVDMYSKCRDPDDAFRAFLEMPLRNDVSWNSILSGLVYNEKHSDALVLFDSMRKAGIEADCITLVNLLKTSKHCLGAIQCKLLHSVILRRGHQFNLFVLNSLIDAYAKCNRVELAWKVFSRMEPKDSISWGTMIAGFTFCGRPNDAIAVFNTMSMAAEKPSRVTILELLMACSVSADLRRSKLAHGIATRSGLAFADVMVGTSIIDMYGKCAAIKESRNAFDCIPQKNVVSWSAMIAAYGMNGLANDALSMYAQMKLHGVKPNEITALSVLSACSHGGLVEEGLHFFRKMVLDDGIEPILQHYSCMVDMLARAGRLKHAKDIIKNLPPGMENGVSLWGTFLSACRRYEDTKLGVGASSRVLELEPSSLAGYVLTSSVYAVSGQWDNAVRMRSLAQERGVMGVPGCSSVHVDNRACEVVTGDYPEYKENLNTLSFR